MATSSVRFRPGDVVDYDPERPDRWCRESTAIAQDVNGRTVLIDTYWGSGYGDSHRLSEAETATARLRFNLADYRQLERHESYTWKDYAPTDRQVVTSQHGLERTLYVRHGAQPDLATRIENAREAVADAEEKVRSAQRSLDYARRALADLEGITTPA